MSNYCNGCPLEGKADPFTGRGTPGARFMVITDAPCHKPQDYGRLMPKMSSTVLASRMEDAGFGKEDFFLFPQIRCPFDPDKYSTKEKKLIQKTCRSYMADEIRHHKPKVLLPLGAGAAQQVFGRAVQITKVRGLPEYTEEFRTTVLPLLNPIQVALYPQHDSTFKSDCNTLGRLVDNKYDIRKASSATFGQYEYIDDLQFLIDAKPEILAFDTENTGLRWFAPDAAVLTMQFCIEEGVAFMLPWDHPDDKKTARQKARLKKQLRELLCNPDTKVVGQNNKYDCGYVYEQTGVRYRIGGDTLMLATLLDENALTKNLDDLVKRFVPEMAGYADMFNATVDKGRMIELPLDDKFLSYGAGDADATFRLHQVLYPMVEADPKLLAHYNHVTLPGLNAFASIEHRGLYVDESAVDEFEEYMAERTAEQYASLLKQVPRSIKRLHIDKGLKFSRKDFLLDILFRHPDGFKLKPKAFTKTTAKLDPERRVPSTSTKDHLPFFYDSCPFTFELANYIKDERILGTNVRGFKSKYIVDGMVRPTYNLHIAVTGRTASEDPNGQNFPKRGPTATKYRTIFVAPKGYILLEADLSQAELRIAADMANEHTMLDIYRNKGDIHTATATIVMGVSMEKFKTLEKAEQKAARQKAKAVNFGFLYGMGWRKFIVYAKTQYGVEFTDKEAQRIREAFFDKYTNLPEWHLKMRQFAHKNAYVRSYSGRIRHLPMIDSGDELIVSEAERQAINSPVQEFGSSLGVMTLGRIEQEVDPDYLSVVGFVHDAIYCYVPEQYVEWGAKTLKRYMETNPLREWFGLKMKCPIVADVSFGRNLGETFEMEGFELDKPYDFSKFWNEDEQTGIVLPRQKTPPNNGLLC